jgi:peptidoglycan hydrolase-like protein with peptidoglycan-binding domain
MLKQRIRTLAVTGVTITAAAALVTLGTTGASAAPRTASASGHVTAPRAAHAAADPSGCVTETFTEADEPYYEPCVADAQILLNDLWYYQQAHPAVYLGADQLLTVDGSYGPDTASDVGSFQSKWNLTVDHELGPKTWGDLCYIDALHGYNGVYYRDAGCPSVFGL